MERGAAAATRPSACSPVLSCANVRGLVAGHPWPWRRGEGAFAPGSSAAPVRHAGGVPTLPDHTYPVFQKPTPNAHARANVIEPQRFTTNHAAIPLSHNGIGGSHAT